MLIEKMRFVVMATVALAALGALALGYRSSADEPPPPVTIAPPPAGGADPATEMGETTTSVHTKNFEVTAPTARVARLIAEAAERHRKEQAVLWLGKELPAWEKRCPVKIRVTPGGCGGATTFAYGPGGVESRDMHLEGSLEQLLCSALPHEVTHTVLADYFGSPAPRWADEGGAVMSEDDEEQQRYDRVMRDTIVKKGRLIPLSRLLRITEFPHDVMALYTEGHSLTRFLVNRKDRKTFLAFVKQGRKGEWDAAAKEQYGFGDVQELETAWLKEVRKDVKADPVALDSGMPMARTGLPEEGPLPGVARLQPDGKGVVLEVVRTRLNYRAAYAHRPDGSYVPEVKSSARHQALEVAVPLAEVKAYHPDGTAIDAGQLAGLLKKEAPVLVTPNRSAVHERWARVVKEETIVIEVKATELKQKEKKEEPPALPAPVLQPPGAP